MMRVKEPTIISNDHNERIMLRCSYAAVRYGKAVDRGLPHGLRRWS